MNCKEYLMRNQLFSGKVLFSLLAVVMCLGFTAMSYGQAVVSVEPAEVESPAAGEELMVSINITGGADVAGYELVVNFDPAALSYVSSANADYLPAGAFPVPAVATDSSVKVAATSLAGAAAEADGTLATVTFEVVAAAASTISLSDIIIADADGNALEITAEDGVITLEGAEPAADDAAADDAADDAVTDDTTADDAADDAVTDDAAPDDAVTDDAAPDEVTPEPEMPVSRCSRLHSRTLRWVNP